MFIWLTEGALLSWIIHFEMALLATPLLLGHKFMATINPDTRIGLSGMINGYVDRQWAKHHYSKWYKDNFEESPAFASTETPDVAPERSVAPAATEE
jgi:cytochrome b subunit of formate dehydrogenase